MSPTGHNKNADPMPRRAFTLIELMLVMALLTIIIAVSAPSLSRFFRGRNLDSEARRLISLTRYAQSRAVSEGVPMVLWIDLRQDRYGLRQETSYTGEDAKAVDLPLAQDVHITATTMSASSDAAVRLRPGVLTDPNRPTLRFQPDGSIDETSPRRLVLRENTGEEIVISQSRNRQNYEIETHPGPRPQQ